MPISGAASAGRRTAVAGPSSTEQIPPRWPEDLASRHAVPNGNRGWTAPLPSMVGPRLVAVGYRSGRRRSSLPAGSRPPARATRHCLDPWLRLVRVRTPSLPSEGMEAHVSAVPRRASQLQPSRTSPPAIPKKGRKTDAVDGQEPNLPAPLERALQSLYAPFAHRRLTFRSRWAWRGAAATSTMSR